jgi:hypothetical protein
VTFTDSINDQLMAMAMHRYCLGRSSYIVGSCIESLDDVWNQLTENTRTRILVETKEAIAEGLAGMEIDARGWQAFVDRHEGKHNSLSINNTSE